MVKFIAEQADGGQVLGIVLMPKVILDLVDGNQVIDIDIKALAGGTMDSVGRVMMFFAENEADAKRLFAPFIDDKTVIVEQRR